MVEYIEYNGKKYPIRIGYLVMKAIKEKTGESLGKALQLAGDDPTIHETVLFAALKSGAHAEKQELDITEEDIPFVLDYCFNQYLKALSSPKFFPKEDRQESDESGKAQSPEPKITLEEPQI